MIVTTTNSIEGREISRYNDPIAANVVIGTNIFSDIGASYVDFFGGRSTSYEKKMQEMYKRVTETLKQRFSFSFIHEKFPKKNPIKYVVLLWTKCGIYWENKVLPQIGTNKRR